MTTTPAHTVTRRHFIQRPAKRRRAMRIVPAIEP